MKIQHILIVFLALLMSKTLYSQKFNEQEVITAAGDELARNMHGLALPGYPKPFFISYAISHMSSTRISASRGTILSYDETPSMNSASVRLLIGDYKETSEALYGEPGAMVSLPMEASANSVKRAFWNMSDVSYREALNIYGRKMSFLKQNPITGKMKDIADFEEIKTNSYMPDSAPKEIVNSEQIKDVMRQLSGIFSNYNAIANSSVQFENLSYTAYQLTSEGTLTKSLHGLTNLTINASMVLENGTVLSDAMKITVGKISEMPTLSEMKESIVTFIDNIIALSKAKYAEEKYKGPVLFDNSTYSVYLTGSLLNPGALIAIRPQIGQALGDPFSLRLGENILDERLSIKNYTSLKEYNGKKLLGSYDVDADGVTPNPEMILIENGNIASVMNGRIPTAGAEKSTGSSRWKIGQTPSTVVAPGTIHYIAKETTKESSMKKQLLKAAKKAKKDYAYIVKRISTGLSLIYQINVDTEEETLVRGIQLPLLDLDVFKDDILHISDEEKVMNGLSPSNTPISFIAPKSMIIDDVQFNVVPIPATNIVHLEVPSTRK